MSWIKFIYCKPCILSPLKDFCASNKGQRQTYKSVSNFLCALHKEHRQIPQTKGTSLLPCVCVGSVNSVVSDSFRFYGLQPAKLLCPWDSLSKNTGVGSHALLQGILPIHGSNPSLLHCWWIFYHWAPPSMREAEMIQPSHLCIHGTAHLRAGVGRKAVFPSPFYWGPRFGTVLL